MSRIGKKPVLIPKAVTTALSDNSLKVKGPKGELESRFHRAMKIEVKGSEIYITRPNDLKENKALHGLTRALIQNMVVGVTKGYEKTLEIVGKSLKIVFSNSVIPPSGPITAMMSLCK